MKELMEGIFDVAYLVIVISIGFKMLLSNGSRKQYYLFGIMALVLGIGDAFHLVPRIIATINNNFENLVYPLGFGKMVTSITMTIFYVILYHIWRIRYYVKDKKILSLSIYILAIIRIGLCLMPQNGWPTINPPYIWGIYRNIPFVILGVIIIVLFYKSASEKKDLNFKDMWLTILLSFIFYIPVVLFSDFNPMIGMLMIPKTCAYVWTIFIGYKSMLKE